MAELRRPERIRLGIQCSFAGGDLTVDFGLLAIRALKAVEDGDLRSVQSGLRPAQLFAAALDGSETVGEEVGGTES